MTALYITCCSYSNYYFFSFPSLPVLSLIPCKRWGESGWVSGCLVLKLPAGLNCDSSGSVQTSTTWVTCTWLTVHLWILLLVQGIINHLQQGYFPQVLIPFSKVHHLSGWRITSPLKEYLSFTPDMSHLHSDLCHFSNPSVTVSVPKGILPDWLPYPPVPDY